MPSTRITRIDQLRTEEPDAPVGTLLRVQQLLHRLLHANDIKPGTVKATLVEQGMLAGAEAAGMNLGAIHFIVRTGDPLVGMDLSNRSFENETLFRMQAQMQAMRQFIEQLADTTGAEAATTSVPNLAESALALLVALGYRQVAATAAG